VKLFKIIILLFIIYIPLSIAQETEDPFRELEIDKPIEVKEKDKAKPDIIKKQKPKKTSTIKNPKTYLAAKDYILKGIIISSQKSFAIIGTKDTLDQVVTIGESLGNEGWKIQQIAEEYILVGDDKNKKKFTKIYIID